MIQECYLRYTADTTTIRRLRQPRSNVCDGGDGDDDYGDVGGDGCGGHVWPPPPPLKLTSYAEKTVSSGSTDSTGLATKIPKTRPSRPHHHRSYCKTHRRPTTNQMNHCCCRHCCCCYCCCRSCYYYCCLTKNPSCRTLVKVKCRFSRTIGTLVIRTSAFTGRNSFKNTNFETRDYIYCTTTGIKNNII